MIRTSITEAKSRLSELLIRVVAGETVLILKRGRPIARIEPIRESDLDPGDEARLVRLEQAGLIRRGASGRSAMEILGQPVRIGSGGGVLEVLIEERRSGR